MASHTSTRPLSPHLQIWRWGPHMLVSIVHRALGVGIALVGLPLFVWWLAATASGPESYEAFVDWFTYHDGRLNIVGWVLAVGLSWAVLQHLMSGIRHLVLDTGAGYELKRNKLGAMGTFVASALLTAALWAYILGMK
ncbi:succinate dehydrogenase, cytochrome b556 subunit [Sphingomonas sp.]|uniref:succinate dehydrogenase, cytochrome b556 subunit n=1 Tax=Sphingomonas sp. TaxID=28214 RepID=UPI003AFFF6A1